jgi:CHAT domain-containing protein
VLRCIVIFGFLFALTAGPVRGEASCSTLLARIPVAPGGYLKVHGTAPSEARITVVKSHEYMIEVAEAGNDALVEIVGANGQVIASADHPERRSGTRRAMVTAHDSAPITVRVTGKEHDHLEGTATVGAVDLAALADSPTCVNFVRIAARSDADYAQGQSISLGRSTASPGSARQAFGKAVDGYRAAEAALADEGDDELRGEMALAVAGAEYLELQDWSKAAVAAGRAAELFGTGDPYRHARAEALVAAAWMEIALQVGPGQPVPGVGEQSSGLLAQVRASLRALSRYHLKRGERYDAGLQLTNLGLAYYYDGRYPECAAISLQSSALFGSLHEIQRRAQAWQNRALCFVELGRLSAAAGLYDRALRDIGPTPYPKMYLAAVNNTALLHYEIGDFDRSMELFDRGLAFANTVQSTRDAAQSLYGLGVVYDAMGDENRARDFLERALSIRTAALDGYGRMATLAALAAIEASQGQLDRAIAADREAMALATDPSKKTRIGTQLAAHIAAAGRHEEAVRSLDELIAQDDRLEPLSRARALVQRAIIQREVGNSRQALADLKEARPHLLEFGTITDDFEVELEIAKTLSSLGRPEESLVAVDRALGKSDALRHQTANPELRAHLQSPLRPAYDLKLDLLWDKFERATGAKQTIESARLAVLAFESADESRARSFADIAAQKYSPGMRRDLAAELARREELYSEIAARRFALGSRLEISGPTDARSLGLARDIAGLQRDIDAVNTTIAAHVEDPQAEVGKPSGKPKTLPRLPSDTALVAYWLGAEHAYAWVIASGGIHWVRLTAPNSIADGVRAFHHSLTHFIDVPAPRRLQDAANLYGQVIEPVDPWIGQVRQWLIIPDGALSYVPFAALRRANRLGGSFVAARHDVALTPAAWMMKRVRLPVPAQDRRGLLMVADPVYEAGDARLVGLVSAGKLASSPPGALAASIYRRLPFSAEEAQGISAEFPSKEVDQLIGLNATRERVLAMDWSKYRYIHFATHGLVDAKIPQLSALILGAYDAGGRRVEGAVRVADLSVRTLTADVAVFSACDTALGQETLSEGQVGIGYTTLARGARAVVASLWPVSDEMSAQLMTEFYRHLVRDSMSAPAALSSAMRSALARDSAADPALWAPFQVSVVNLDSGNSRGRWARHHQQKLTWRHRESLGKHNNRPQ